eukprot:TRINITY_DN25918_c0_g1_i1.p1 TRINITY_DN25918_c0_g1~~TRINITY_DN25918_c0_g1_i1.p1  ORF type:complete len:400 (+),score=87.89 TRINITY_DN25918_c0_g1_i1:83-1282(+)
MAAAAAAPAGTLNVLIVGAGVTGSALAAALRRRLGAAVRLSVWDKARGPGGRMSTLRAPAGLADGAKVDSGAQYISRRVAEDELSSRLGWVYGSLRSAGVLVPLQGAIQGPSPYSGGAAAEVEDLVAPDGLSAIPKHLLELAVADSVAYETPLRTLDAGDGGVAANGASGWDVVVLTMPPPQLLGEGKFGLGGTFLDRIAPEVRAGLAQVSFSTRFAVALFWPPGTDLGPPCRGWVAQYFKEGAVRYVAQDAAKRGVAERQGPSLLLHSSAPFALQRPAGESEPWEAAQGELLADLAAKLPGLPPPAGVRIHRWRYSQVWKGYDGRSQDPVARPLAPEGGRQAPGAVELCSVRGPGGREQRVLAAGDAFATASNFEGAVQSALACADYISAHFPCAAAL